MDVEPLDAVVDLEAALVDGAPLVHEDLASNVAAHVVQRKGDYDGGVARRRIVLVARRFLYDRGASAAIENRAVVAQWDAPGGGADDLGHDAGADSDPQRHGRDGSACSNRRYGSSRRSSAAASGRRS